MCIRDRGELPGPGLPGAGSEEGVQDQREDHGGAVALKLRRLLPGVAVGSPADKGQAGVKRLARLVQQGAVEELTVRRVRQGAGSLGAEDPGRCLDVYKRQVQGDGVDGVDDGVLLHVRV